MGPLILPNLSSLLVSGLKLYLCYPAHALTTGCIWLFRTLTVANDGIADQRYIVLLQEFFFDMSPYLQSLPGLVPTKHWTSGSNHFSVRLCLQSVPITSAISPTTRVEENVHALTSMASTTHEKSRTCKERRLWSTRINILTGQLDSTFLAIVLSLSETPPSVL